MRLRFLLPILLLLGLATPAQAIEVGVNETNGQTLNAAATAQQLGAGWIRLWGSWQAAEPARGSWDAGVLKGMNDSVAAAKARGLKVLMIVQRSPAWASNGKGGSQPPTDASDFGSAMGELARRVPAVDAWELWNEEDEGTFFTGGADPAKYAAMVKSAHGAIKRVQPGDVVVTGATTGNNYEFIGQLYKHGVKGSFDAVAVHTDTACSVVGPGNVYREPNGRIGRFSFTGYREVHAVMAAHGDGDKPIWMTELGWNTQDTSPGSCPFGRWAGQKPLGVTEGEQAQFLSEAYSCLATDPYVQVAFWFGLQDIANSPFAGGYGLYRLGGGAKPAAGAFAALRAGIAPQPCGGAIDDAGPRFVVRKPTDGAAFVKQMGIDVKAVDAPGGAGIRGITLNVDGKFFRYFGDGHAKMPVLWGSREWGLGKHTLTFIGEDEAKNTSTLRLTVRKVRTLPKARTSAAITAALVDPTTVSVSGRVTAARAKVRGKVFVVFQRWAEAKRRWTTVHRVKRDVRRAVTVTQALAPGRWRAFIRYPGAKRLKRSRSAPAEFEIAAPAPPA